MTTAGRQFSVNNSQLLISCCHFFAVFPVPLEHLEESCVMGPFKCSQESPSVIFCSWIFGHQRKRCGVFKINLVKVISLWKG